jgi:hypothetical protein
VSLSGARRAAGCAASSLRAPGRGGSFALALALLSLLSAGCITGYDAGWGAAVEPAQREEAFRDLPPEAARALIPLSEIFYQRIASRRFNSRATFEDPSVRQFLPSIASYSDYYAALVDALDRAYIKYNRPTRIDLLSVTRMENGSLSLLMRFIGENDLPLRWWNAELLRADEWQWRDGRWWIVPGRV